MTRSVILKDLLQRGHTRVQVHIYSLKCEGGYLCENWKSKSPSPPVYIQASNKGLGTLGRGVLSRMTTIAFPGMNSCFFSPMILFDMCWQVSETDDAYIKCITSFHMKYLWELLVSFLWHSVHSRGLFISFKNYFNIFPISCL